MAANSSDGSTMHTDTNPKGLRGDSNIRKAAQDAWSDSKASDSTSPNASTDSTKSPPKTTGLFYGYRGFKTTPISPPLSSLTSITDPGGSLGVDDHLFIPNIKR
nr:uncharacterized protein CI109_002588 [Kwoniella shandongensis]KAA5528831.1 hypothetical protein CI109_002588 [Kwoniella shandongensis]